MADEPSTASTETVDTTAESARDTTAPDADQHTEDLGEAGKAALAEERRRAKTAERTATAASRELAAVKAELDKIRAASMSEQEKAVAEAKAEGAKTAAEEARRTFGGRLVDAELKAALAGRQLDDKQRTALLSRLDRTQFLSDDGEVDVKAVTEWADDVAPARKPTSFDGGPRGGAAKPTGMSAFIRERANR